MPFSFLPLFPNSCQLVKSKVFLLRAETFNTLYDHMTYLNCDNCFFGKVTAFLVKENNDFELICDGKLINFLSYHFKIEIINISTVVSMNDLFNTLTTSLCIRDNLKKSSWVMSF